MMIFFTSVVFPISKGKVKKKNFDLPSFQICWREYQSIQCRKIRRLGMSILFILGVVRDMSSGSQIPHCWVDLFKFLFSQNCNVQSKKGYHIFCVLDIKQDMTADKLVYLICLYYTKLFTLNSICLLFALTLLIYCLQHNNLAKQMRDTNWQQSSQTKGTTFFTCAFAGSNAPDNILGTSLGVCD